MAIDQALAGGAAGGGRELVAEQLEIDPVLGAAPLAAAELPDIEIRVREISAIAKA